VLTWGRRCSRGRPAGDVASVSRREGVPARWSLPRWRRCSRRRAPPLARRRGPCFRATGSRLLPLLVRRDGVATPLRRDAFPPTARRSSGAPAFFFPSGRAAEQRRMKTPRGVVGLVSNPNCPPPFLNPRRGASRRKGPPCPWLAAAPGQVAPAVMLCPPRMLGGKGAAGSNPFPVVASGFACTRRTLACVPAGRLGRAPPRAGWRGWTGGAARLAQLSGAGQRDKGKEIRLASGVHTPAGEGDGEEGAAVRV
jgi:hypothetical protein